jgi:hypothetical protein
LPWVIRYSIESNLFNESRRKTQFLENQTEAAHSLPTVAQRIHVATNATDNGRSPRGDHETPV